MKTRSRSLSKSRFCYGLQCLRQLWWRVHEPDAPELVAPPSLQAVFDRGHRIGGQAQAEFAGGLLISREYYETAEKIADTTAALQANAPAIFEASFAADDVFVAVDILERRGDAHVLVEVKSTFGVKEQFIPDVAIQLHVVRSSGVNVSRAEVMHVHPACRCPGVPTRFVRADVTAAAEKWLPDIPRHVQRMKDALDGPLPAVDPGSRCSSPYPCPFDERCCPGASPTADPEPLTPPSAAPPRSR